MNQVNQVNQVHQLQNEYINLFEFQKVLLYDLIQIIHQTSNPRILEAKINRIIQESEMFFYRK